jgi:ankyrin repeat protein
MFTLFTYKPSNSKYIKMKSQQSTTHTNTQTTSSNAHRANAGAGAHEEKGTPRNSTQATLANRHATPSIWANVATFLPPKKQLQLLQLNKTINARFGQTIRSNAYRSCTVPQEKQRLKALATAIRKNDYQGFFDKHQLTISDLLENDPVLEHHSTPRWQITLLELVCSLNKSWLNDLYERVIAPSFSKNPTPNNQVAGMPLIHWIAACNQSAQLKILLQSDTDERTRLLAITANNGASLLHVAAQYGHSEVVKLLLAAGANVNSRRQDQATPLYIAAFHGYSPVVELLLTAGANVNSRRQDQATPLHAAAQHGHSEVVVKLLAAGATVDAKHQSQATPLYVAAQFGHPQVVKLLLTAGANVDSRFQDQSTPLYVAAQFGHPQVVKLLLTAGANVNSRRQDQATPPDAAAFHGHTPVVELLLTAGANVNSRRQSQATPLYVAAQNGHSEVVVKLLAAGADPCIESCLGDTPLDIALMEQQHDVVLLLETEITARKEQNHCRNIM